LTIICRIPTDTNIQSVFFIRKTASEIPFFFTIILPIIIITVISKAAIIVSFNNVLSAKQNTVITSVVLIACRIINPIIIFPVALCFLYS
jgi:hypothetical protein